MMHHPIHGLLFLLITALTLTACVSNAPKPNPTAVMRPAWIFQPEEGVSASAAFHVQGRQAQEELAISRAREEFAKRYGVKISSDHTLLQVVTNDRPISISQKDIREEVRNNEVKARVKAKWIDPESGHLWVWLVPFHP